MISSLVARRAGICTLPLLSVIGPEERVEGLAALHHLLVALHHQVVDAQSSQALGADLLGLQGGHELRVDRHAGGPAQLGGPFLGQPPHVVRGPGLVDDVLEHLLVHHAPVHQLAGHAGVRSELLHRAVVPEGVDRLAGLGVLLPDLHHAGGVLGEGHGVAAVGHQRLGGLLGLGRVVPGVDPAHLHLGLGVGGLDAQGEGIQVAHHLRGWGRRRRSRPCRSWSGPRPSGRSR